MSEPIVETKKGISPVWILPLLAICVGGWLLFKSYRDAGIDIHLRVDDAVGITVGKTPVIFKGAKVGLVKKIEATADLQGMVLTIEMSKKAKSHLVEDVAFWVEKVEVQAGRVTGLDTLLSGGYIGMQLGSSHVPSLEFTALSSRPPVPDNAPGLHLNLVADTLYSVQVGSGIYHKSILIGSVQEYSLNDEGAVNISIYIEPEYAPMIKEGSRFWNASGISVKGGVTDLKVRIASLAAIIKGGIIVETPPILNEGKPAVNGQLFTLYEDKDMAQYGINLSLELSTAEGISEGTTKIMYRGMKLGHVQRITINRNNKHSVTATLLLDPRAEEILNSGTKFYLVKPEVSLKGVRNLDTLIEGSFITFIPGEGTPQHHFVVKEEDQGRIFATEHADGRFIKLKADSLGTLKVGSPILYKKMEVGEITGFKLDGKSEKIILTGVVDREYGHLVKGNSRFYNVSGIEVSASLANGLKLQTGNLESIVAGGVGFFNPGAGKSAANNHIFPLFPDQSAAEQSDWRKVTIHFKETIGLKPGIKIKYNDISIGHVDTLKYEKKMTMVKVEALVDKEAKELLREGTKFWLVRPEFSLTGTQHLDTLIAGPYIAIAPGKGKFRSEFKAVVEVKTTTEGDRGFEVVLEADELFSLKVGSPIYYRRVKVGEVIGFDLSPTFQKVLVQATIFSKFIPIIRQGTRFWNASGVHVSGGIFSGLDVSTESFDALMTGGVALATPEGEEMGGAVKHGHHFILHPHAEESWTEWSPILRAQAPWGRPVKGKPGLQTGD